MEAKIEQLVEVRVRPEKEYNSYSIYLISMDLEIGDGDWAFEVRSFYPTGLPPVLKCLRREGDEMILETGWRRQIKFPQTGIEMAKIIAGTDPQLNSPKISDENIRDLFGGDCEKVYIEYHRLYDGLDESAQPQWTGLIPKVDSNNELVIRIVKKQDGKTD